MLKYIENDAARYKTFVANRVSFIKEATKPSQWKYVNSAVNPADQASRGLSAESLLQSEDWIHGPAFLLRPESEWPECPDYSSHSAEEKRKEMINQSESNQSKAQALLQQKMLRYKQNFEQRMLTTENLSKAELKLISLCQKRKYAEEIKHEEK